LNIAEKDLADLAFLGLLTHIKDKLEGQQCSDLNQVLQKALAQENRAKDVKQFSRFKDNANKEKEDHIINVVDYDNASAREYDLDICVAEWVQESESKPFACSALTPTPVKKKEIKYTFDVSKCDRIFDMLLQEKIIRVRKGHVIPPLEELAIRAYCKWHNSFSHATNGCNVFRRQVQSAISDGRLTFIESSKIKLDTDPFSTNVIDFTNKKMLIRSDQTRSAKGKNVIIDDNAHPRMIKQKSAEAGLWKINERNRQSAPIPKRTIKKLLDKYTLCKTNKVFSRFGGTKCPSYPSGTGGRDPAGCFQAEFVSSEHMYRRPLHEKRAQFNMKLDYMMPFSFMAIMRSRSQELLIHAEDKVLVANIMVAVKSSSGWQSIVKVV
jgi:hypothetical protein